LLFSAQDDLRTKVRIPEMAFWRWSRRGEYQAWVISVDFAGNRAEQSLGQVSLSGSAGPSPFWLDTMQTSRPADALYPCNLAEPLGVPIQWPDPIPDPLVIYDGVVQLAFSISGS